MGACQAGTFGIVSATLVQKASQNMATPLASAMDFEWPEEVVTFAVERGFDQYLQPVLDMTKRVFPDARRIAVRLQPDPEIPDYWFVVFEVEVAGLSVDQMVELDRRWSQGYFAIRSPSPGNNMVLALESPD